MAIGAGAGSPFASNETSPTIPLPTSVASSWLLTEVRVPFDLAIASSRISVAWAAYAADA